MIFVAKLRLNYVLIVKATIKKITQGHFCTRYKSDRFFSLLFLIDYDICKCLRYLIAQYIFFAETNRQTDTKPEGTARLAHVCIG